VQEVHLEKAIKTEEEKIQHHAVFYRTYLNAQAQTRIHSAIVRRRLCVCMQTGGVHADTCYQLFHRQLVGRRARG